MTGWIYGWMKGLAFFFIFMTAILNCLPDHRYRKYVRFFLGMLMLLLMTGPLIELFHLDEKLSRAASRGLLEAELYSLENDYQVEGLQEEYLYQGYQAEIENQIKAFLEERGVLPAQVSAELDMDEMKVSSIEIRAKLDSQGILYQSEIREEQEKVEQELEEIKIELSEVYGTEPSHIDVTVQK